MVRYGWISIKSVKILFNENEKRVLFNREREGQQGKGERERRGEGVREGDGGRGEIERKRRWENFPIDL